MKSLILAGLLVGVIGLAVAAIMLSPNDNLGTDDARLAFVERDDQGAIEIKFASAGRSDIGSPVQNTLAVECPVWSPDGSRVAYIGHDAALAADSQLFVAKADGSERKAITPAGFLAYLGPAWSPDGQWIAIVSYADQNLYVMRPDGSDQRRLSSARGVNIIPLWSPDGQQLLYSSNDDGEIYAVRRDGSAPRRLTDRPGLDVFSSWSPDGRLIALNNSGGDEGMFVMNADGSNVRRIVEGKGFSPIWSPDGKHLAFTRLGDKEIDIMVADADGRNARVLVETPGRKGPFVWSPDGEQIAFMDVMNLDASTDEVSIYVVDVDGSGLRRVTKGTPQADCPAWLPAMK